MADNLLPDLEKHIRVVGEQMVCCERHCQGIALDHAQGILPRSLVLETENRQPGTGAVVIGINPATSGDEERQFYREREPNYEVINTFWYKNVFKHPYHTKLRKLLDKVGLTGPILWTELVKCESASAAALPLQTYRTCVHHHLRQELAVVPSEWPLIAVGANAYFAAAYLFAEHTVIGVPHPTGSFGHFNRLARSLEDPALAQHAADFITESCRQVNKVAVWLPEDASLPET